MECETELTETVLSALSAVYTGIFFIDLRKDSYSNIKVDEEVKKLLDNISSAQDAITLAIRGTVQPECLEDTLAFVNLKTLSTRMKNGHSIDHEYRGIISGWVRGSFVEVKRDSKGKLTQVLYTYQLIDEARRLEIENQKKSELQREIEAVKKNQKQQVPGVWSIKFNERGQISSCIWSKSFRKILGYTSKSEFPDTLDSWKHCIHPDDRERVLNTFWNTVQDYSGKKIYDIEYRVKVKTGEFHWFRAYGRVTRGENGTPVSFDGFFVNMDEKHATYEILYKVIEEAEQAKNQALLENEIISSVSRMYFAIFRIDLLNNYYEEVSSDNSVHLITGHSGKAQEKMEEICNTLVSSEYREVVRRFFDLSTVADRLLDVETIELEYYAADGNWHEARFIEKKRNQEGRVTHILYVTRIVSRQKQKELEQERLRIACKVAEKANEAKTAFLFNMSHDIRTPMNAILGYEKLIKKELKDPKLLHYQERMEQASEILLSIINNVLDMARIESGKMELDEVRSSAGRVIASVNEVFEAAATEKGIQFEYTVNVAHSHILCDVTKIQEIFTNLISNAVKYTKAGGRVAVRTRELPYDRTGYALIETTVEDTGIGMSGEFLPHLFDAFSREHNTTDGKVAGTGLGMPIVKKLVELMNGEIRVESRLGEGTKFTVTIPHKLADNVQVETTPAANTNPQENLLKGRHILLAEDNELNAEIAMAILEGMGMSVELATDGIKCVDKLKQNPDNTYDLILMDIQMPGLDGYQATQAIRKLPDPKKAGIPIVAMTANAFEEDKKKAFEMGMNGHIAKPVDISKMEETIALVLAK